MKLLTTVAYAALFLAGAVLSAGAQATIPQPASPSLNRFSLGARFGLNIHADFQQRTVGRRFASARPGPGKGGALDRFYDDGYVRVDGSGNAGGLTWFWGYDDAAQVDSGSDTLSFHASQGSTGGRALSDNANDDPQLGFELTYQRQLGTFSRDLRWGIENAFGWTDLRMSSSTRAFSTLSRITDRYSLGGIIPPDPPYRGAFSGPSALIDDSPNRRIHTANLESHASQTFEADLFSFRLGPYLEVPLGSRWLLQFSAGLSLAYIDSRFSFAQETGSSTLGRLTSARGADSEADWLAGPYVQAGLSFAVRSCLSLFGGVQYHHLGSFHHRAGPARASLDLGSTVFATAGLSCSF